MLVSPRSWPRAGAHRRRAGAGTATARTTSPTTSSPGCCATSDPAGAPADAERWNHNIHYHRVVLAAVPAGCRRALDVGCGEGMLTRRLRAQADVVVGLDRDLASIEVARAQQSEGVHYVLADLLAPPLSAASFDLVCAVASLHHVDARTGLRRMADLLRPGGVLVVVGLARSRLPMDLGRELAAVTAHRWLRPGRTRWEYPSPVVWPPPVTYPRMRTLAQGVLPGVRYTRHVLWRYSLVWTKPT